METSYHSFKVPYQFRVAKGSLQTLPKELIFEPVFPGTKAELKLKVFSSFAEEMITDMVAPVPPDPRFSFKHNAINGRNVIMSGERSFIGKVIFDPAATCRLDNSCYAGFDLQSNSKLLLIVAKDELCRITAEDYVDNFQERRICDFDSFYGRFDAVNFDRL